MLVVNTCHTVISPPYACPCVYPSKCPASVQFQVLIVDNGARNATIYDGNLAFIAVVYKFATKFTMVWSN
jgi:hypothetical protein